MPKPNWRKRLLYLGAPPLLLFALLFLAYAWLAWRPVAGVGPEVAAEAQRVAERHDAALAAVAPATPEPTRPAEPAPLYPPGDPTLPTTQTQRWAYDIQAWLRPPQVTTTAYSQPNSLADLSPDRPPPDLTERVSESAAEDAAGRADPDPEALAWARRSGLRGQMLRALEGSLSDEILGPAMMTPFSFYRPYSEAILVRRAQLNGDAGRVDRLLTAAVREACTNSILNWDSGYGMGFVTHFVIGAAADGPVDDATLVRLDALVEASRLSPDEYEALWRANVVDQAERLESRIRYDIEKNAGDWTVDWMLDNKLSPAVANLAGPVIHNEIQRWAAAMLRQDWDAADAQAGAVAARCRLFGLDAKARDRIASNLRPGPKSDELPKGTTVSDFVEKKLQQDPLGAERERQITNVRLAIALARYRAAHGRWADSPAELRAAGLVPWLTDVELAEFHIGRTEARGYPKQAPEANATGQAFIQALDRFRADHQYRMPKSAGDLKPYLSGDLTEVDCAARFVTAPSVAFLYRFRPQHEGGFWTADALILPEHFGSPALDAFLREDAPKGGEGG